MHLATPAENSAVGTRRWPRTFLGGLALWVATVVVVLLTGSLALVPTLILLGSFLVPVTFVAWAFERRDSGELTATLVFSTFVAGGVLGVLGASVLERYLLHPSAWLFFGVGLIEEAAKLGALMLLTRRLRTRSVHDGIILGAAVGFGFAAFESAGYSLAAMFTVDGLSVSQIVQTEVLRGLLAPFGHGLWTGILGGVLFAGWRRGSWLTPRLVLAYLGVSILHGLWDSMDGIALFLTLILTETPAFRSTPNGWLVAPTPEQIDLFSVLQWAGLAIIAVIGLAWLVTLWRRASRRAALAGR
ncbi:PrsW family glutamic-type intramembrane protease [Actinoplanes sp. NPDC051411]|uniref:PrsW family intramembrane metalloprotease n=1 Tax=Actinoplanes sp. NPDC051411 TaxID=3155522 RepID=UPI00341498EB